MDMLLLFQITGLCQTLSLRRYFAILTYFNTCKQQITRAKQIALSLQGDAAPAYSLISYDPELKPTMEFVFGGTVSFINECFINVMLLVHL